MIPLGQGQHPLGIMKSVKLGPAMNQKTYDLIRNFNNGWVSADAPEYEEQLKIVHDYDAFLGRVFVQVKLTDSSKRMLLETADSSEYIYFAVDVYPVCCSMPVRETLLHVLDRLVTNVDVTYSIYAVHGL